MPYVREFLQSNRNGYSLGEIQNHMYDLGARWPSPSTAMNTIMAHDPGIKRIAKGHYTYVPTRESGESTVSTNH
jgi:hypothetical protein